MARIFVKVNPKTEIFKSKKWKAAIKVAQRKVKSPSKFELQKLTPTDTGYMNSRWKVKPKGLNLLITNDAKYSNFIDKGTRFIKPFRITEKALPIILDKYERQIAIEVTKIK